MVATKFFTPEKVEVTKRLKDGLTLFAKTREVAEAKAKAIRSYFYPIQDENGTPVGFGIPR